MSYLNVGEGASLEGSVSAVRPDPKVVTEYGYTSVVTRMRRTTNALMRPGKLEIDVTKVGDLASGKS